MGFKIRIFYLIAASLLAAVCAFPDYNTPDEQPVEDEFRCKLRTQLKKLKGMKEEEYKFENGVDAAIFLFSDRNADPLDRAQAAWELAKRSMAELKKIKEAAGSSESSSSSSSSESQGEDILTDEHQALDNEEKRKKRQKRKKEDQINF